MTFGLKLNGAHSSQRERQLQKSCVSFGEECKTLVMAILSILPVQCKIDIAYGLPEVEWILQVPCQLAPYPKCKQIIFV